MNPIILALHRMEHDTVVQIMDSKPGVWGYKLNDMLLSSNMEYVKAMRVYGGNVFADVKAFETPKTMANIVRRLAGQGASMITVALLSGPRAIQAAREAAKDVAIIGHAYPSSLNLGLLHGMFNMPHRVLYERLAILACQQGLDGMIVPPSAVDLIPRLTWAEHRIGVGIRTEHWFLEHNPEKDTDHQGVLSPYDAGKLGLTEVVMSTDHLMGLHKNLKTGLEQLSHEINVATEAFNRGLHDLAMGRV